MTKLVATGKTIFHIEQNYGVCLLRHRRRVSFHFAVDTHMVEPSQFSGLRGLFHRQDARDASWDSEFAMIGVPTAVSRRKLGYTAMPGLVIAFISREQQKSEYDWANILFNDSSVGKARCSINGDVFTIFSINIYPEYQGNGYGKAFVDEAKRKYKKVIADKVRYEAVGFWENVGFVRDTDASNWVYTSQ